MRALMDMRKVNTLVLGSSLCFYLSLITMCFMGHTRYNGYLWGVLAFLMIASFLISLLPDAAINLGYRIKVGDVRNSVISKGVCFILFLGIWSYLDPVYQAGSIAIFAVILCYDLYLTGKIIKAISKEKIELRSMLKQIKQLDIEQVKIIYDLLWKSLVSLLVYISFAGVQWISGILLSVLFFAFQLSIALKIQEEMKKIYAGQEKSIRILLAVLVVDTMLIIALTMLRMKLIFLCVLFGFQWALVSDNALKKRTALFRFIDQDDE